ncbi:methionine sulfoxide reductase B 2, partial [Striga asiatica]
MRWRAALVSWQQPTYRGLSQRLTRQMAAQTVGEYWDIGDASYCCLHCGARFWYAERLGKPSKPKVPKYSELVLSDEEIKNLALAEVEKILRRRGMSLRDYGTMPFPVLD